MDEEQNLMFAMHQVLQELHTPLTSAVVSALGRYVHGGDWAVTLTFWRILGQKRERWHSEIKVGIGMQGNGRLAMANCSNFC